MANECSEDKFLNGELVFENLSDGKNVPLPRAKNHIFFSLFEQKLKNVKSVESEHFSEFSGPIKKCQNCQK